MGKFYTMGYGILKGPHKERAVAFQERLCDIHKKIGLPLLIIDIRKLWSGSRNGKAFNQEVDRGMACLINGIWPKAVYGSFPGLANKFGSTKKGLLRYAEDLHTKDSQWWIVRLLDLIRSHERSHAIVLLCGCYDAFKPNGHSWHCHRVPLALELLEHLGEDWKVEHL